MDVKHKAQFELVNNSLWLLLKGYVKDDKPYKSIMSELFKLYMNCDMAENKLSDEWFEESTKNFMEYPNSHKGTELENFAGDLAIGFCDVWEQEKKGNKDYLSFYKCVSKAFINEWVRIRDG